MSGYFLFSFRNCCYFYLLLDLSFALKDTHIERKRMVNDNNELQKRVIQELRTDERDVRVSGCETPTKRTNKQNQINYRNSDKKPMFNWNR